MFQFRSDFDLLRQEIHQFTRTHMEMEHPNSFPPDSTLEIQTQAQNTSVKPVRGNIYALKDVQYRQHRINYQKQQRKKPPVKHYHIETLSSSAELEAQLAVAQYQKKWFRLSSRQKAVKLREFFVSNPDTVAAEHIPQLCSLLLDKKYRKHVQYDSQSGIILELQNLQKIPYLKTPKSEE